MENNPEKYFDMTHKKFNELEQSIKDNKSKGELLDLVREVKDNFFNFIYTQESNDFVEKCKLLKNLKLGEEFSLTLNEEFYDLFNYVETLRGKKLNFDRYTNLEFLVERLHGSINELNSFYKIIAKL